MILAVDLGSHFGWAEVHDGVLVDSGHVNLTKIKGAKRFTTFREFIGDRLCLTKHTEPEPIRRITHIAYEKVMAHAGTSAAHMYGAFEVILSLIAWENDIPLFGFGVGEIKKFATGKGNAKKEHMVDAARALGHNRFDGDDNQADAIFLGLLAHKRLNGLAP